MRHLRGRCRRPATGGTVRPSRFLAAAALAVCLAAHGAALAAQGATGSEPSFDGGERLFREDKPSEAVPLLEKAILESGVDERAWLYLGLSYQQLGKLDDASAALPERHRPGEPLQGALLLRPWERLRAPGKERLRHRHVHPGRLGLDGSYSGAYLNRANARIAIKDYGSAKDDYKRYLELEPESAQRPLIEELIKRLDNGDSRGRAPSRGRGGSKAGR